MYSKDYNTLIAWQNAEGSITTNDFIPVINGSTLGYTNKPTIIADYLFYNSGKTITAINFGGNIQTIGNNAVYNESNISVTIGKNVTKIGIGI